MKLLISPSDVNQATGLNRFQFFLHQRRKKKLVKLILKTAPIGSTVLDVGCASGDISVELSLLGYKVHGIDLEPLRLNLARELANKYKQKIKFESKPFEEVIHLEKYDIVLLGEVLEHFADPVAILKRIKYLLSPAGKVVITAPNMPGLRNRLKFGLLGIFPDNNPAHKYYFDFRRISKIISAAGYDTLYLKSKFTNIQFSFKVLAYLESFLLFWFTWLFPRSGDTLFAIIAPQKN